MLIRSPVVLGITQIPFEDELRVPGTCWFCLRYETFSTAFGLYIIRKDMLLVWTV